MWKAAISPEKRKKIKRSVSFFLSLLLILEMVSGTGMFAEGNRVKAKEETPYAVYLDLSAQQRRWHPKGSMHTLMTMQQRQKLQSR